MSAMRRYPHAPLRWMFLVLGALWSFAPDLRAHVGSPAVFYEGAVGPYQARVTVLPPEVIPGLASVSVRIFSPGVDRVSALPVRWNTGKRGAPPPDPALPVRGETNLYSTELWFMQGGAQSIEVDVHGQAGTGNVLVPVSAVATRVLTMPRGLGSVLAVVGGAIAWLLAAVIGAAVRESVLPPGAIPSRRRLWLARGVTLGAALLTAGAAWLGKLWWDSEAADYRNNRLYHPLQTAASMHTVQGRRFLQIQVVDEEFLRAPALVPDHGKLMHLFMIREPGLEVFGHLHPQRLDGRTFRVELPNLPDGRYSIYGDITFETGFSETLTAQVQLETSSTSPVDGPALTQADPDDAWRTAPPLALTSSPLPRFQNLPLIDGTECRVVWATDGPLMANREVELRFTLNDSSGQPLPLEPYLGMAGHLVLRHEDGSVFTHLHPGGSFSMAAQELFARRIDGRAPLKVASGTNDPICRLPTSTELDALVRSAWAQGSQPVLAFPYAFPKPGRYRLWLQAKVYGQILTAVFDADVSARHESNRP